MPPPLEGFSTRDQLMLTKITSRILVFGQWTEFVASFSSSWSVGVLKELYFINALEEKFSKGRDFCLHILKLEYVVNNFWHFFPFFILVHKKISSGGVLENPFIQGAKLKYQDLQIKVRKTSKSIKFWCKMVNTHWEQLVLGLGYKFLSL